MTVPQITPPTDAPLPAKALKLGNGPGKPDIWVVDLAGMPRVWKTWDRRPPLERRTLGKRLAAHEARVIERLQDLPAFPKLLSMPHLWTVEMSLLPAEPVPEIKNEGALSRLYFDRLEAILRTMHDRGVNHGDLRRKNLLCAANDREQPLMVDFTQCLLITVPASGVQAYALREAIRIDRVTFLKLKRWYLGEGALSEAEQTELEDVPWHLQVGRFMRHNLYRPVRRLLTGKRRRH
jgi:tRNA A-37 threonylcarbamoyl transferase component Bud32